MNAIQYLNSIEGGRSEPEFYIDPFSIKGSNQASISLHKNFNGSGPSSFGGAKEWPVIDVHLPLPPDLDMPQVHALLNAFEGLLRNQGYEPKPSIHITDKK